IRPGGNGEVTATHLAWTTKRGGGRDLPSPIVIDGYILAANMKGIVACYDAKTGKELWQGRLGAARTIFAAPVAFGGLAFFVNDVGETIAVRPGEKMEIVATNKVAAADEEVFRASLTPSDGQLFLRSTQVLYCIGKRK
ncbi:MAG: PQQ-like beta-propeller repeat protein, partial [Planctomycetaceae bacterium]|nr:PQQ-like beta-propeller repeat protein [Planctomycetaceae bacterium]